MTTIGSHLQYTQPVSKEQKVVIPRDNPLDNADLRKSPYCRSQPTTISTSASRTAEVLERVVEIYNRDKQKFQGNTSELDQLESWFKDKSQQILDDPRKSYASPVSVNTPLTYAEASEMVDAITSTLGLSTTEIASILGVTRQTIYAWCRQDGDMSYISDSERLHKVNAFAKYWRKLSEHSAKLALKVEFSGKSLLTELQKKTIQEDIVYQMMSSAAQYINEKKAKLSKETEKWARPRVSEADIMTLEAFIPKPPKK
ncbi:MAG: helix-turn-helix domain-containing protein [Thermoguttaceae bacterium]